jgi:hypothetical protein
MNDPSRGQYLPLLPRSQAIPGASQYRVTRVRCPVCAGGGYWPCDCCNGAGKATKGQLELTARRLEARGQACQPPARELRELAGGMSYRITWDDGTEVQTVRLPPERLAD